MKPLGQAINLGPSNTSSVVFFPMNTTYTTRVKGPLNAENKTFLSETVNGKYITKVS